MGDEEYDRDEEHEAEEPKDDPVPVEAPEPSTEPEGKTNQPEVPAVPASETGDVSDDTAEA